jgi:NADH:ubiquinone oxidoreductase subunit K
MLGGHDASYVRAVWLVASAVGAIALAVLVMLYRRARKAAELEEVERVLADDDPS